MRPQHRRHGPGYFVFGKGFGKAALRAHVTAKVDVAERRAVPLKDSALARKLKFNRLNRFELKGCHRHTSLHENQNQSDGLATAARPSLRRLGGGLSLLVRLRRNERDA